MSEILLDTGSFYVVLVLISYFHYKYVKQRQTGELFK